MLLKEKKNSTTIVYLSVCILYFVIKLFRKPIPNLEKGVRVRGWEAYASFTALMDRLEERQTAKH